MPISDDHKQKILSRLIPGLVNRKVIATNAEGTSAKATYDAAVLAERTARDAFELEADKGNKAEPAKLELLRAAMLDAHGATHNAKIEVGKLQKEIEQLGTAQAAIDVLFDELDMLSNEAAVDILIDELEVETLEAVIVAKRAGLATDEARLAELLE